MIHAAHQRIVRSTTGPAPQTRKVCVVDPAAGDTGGRQHAAAHGVKLQAVATSAEALRLSRSKPVDLWIVSADLPGLSGIELCSMLKARFPSVPVYVMADDYSPEIEQAARQARATLFGVKPEHHTWLSSWAERRSTPHDA